MYGVLGRICLICGCLSFQIGLHAKEIPADTNKDANSPPVTLGETGPHLGESSVTVQICILKDGSVSEAKILRGTIDNPEVYKKINEALKTLITTKPPAGMPPCITLKIKTPPPKQ